MSELQLFMAPLIQPPVSDTLSKVGAQCAPRKCGCRVLPLGPALAALCGWSSRCLSFAAWRVSEMAEGKAGLVLVGAGRALREGTEEGHGVTPRGMVMRR